MRHKLLNMLSFVASPLELESLGKICAKRKLILPPQVHEKKGTEEGCCLTVPPTPPPLPTKLSSPYKKARLGMESGELSRYLPFPLRESGRDLPTVCTYNGSLQTKLPPPTQPART